MAAKRDIGDSYSQTEVDALVAVKADSSALTAGLADKVSRSGVVCNYQTENANRFFPVLLQSAQTVDDNPIIEFQVVGQPLPGSDPYNECTLIGQARAGGWTAHREMFDVLLQKYSSNEDRILGIYGATEDPLDSIVLYFRGGYSYTVWSSASVYSFGSASVTMGSATYAIKNSSGTDVAGTSANISEIQSLLRPSGRYLNVPLLAPQMVAPVFEHASSMRLRIAGVDAMGCDSSEAFLDGALLTTLRVGNTD